MFLPLWRWLGKGEAGSIWRMGEISHGIASLPRPYGVIAPTHLPSHPATLTLPTTTPPTLSS